MTVADVGSMKTRGAGVSSRTAMASDLGITREEFCEDNRARVELGLNKITSSAEDAATRLATGPRGNQKGGKKRKDMNNALGALENKCVNLGLASMVGVSGEGLKVAPLAKSVGGDRKSVV